jgi:hypothetical protein
LTTGALLKVLISDMLFSSTGSRAWGLPGLALGYPYI